MRAFSRSPTRSPIPSAPLLKGPAGEQILAITSVIAAVQMVWGLLAPILPAFAHSLGVGSAEIGMLVAGFGAGRVAVNIPVGIIGRRVNRYWLFVGGAVVVVLASATSGFATTFGELLTLRIVGGMAGGVAITTGQSLLADSTTDATRARAMSVLQGFQLAGGSVGPALGAFVATTWGLNAPFFVSGLFCFGLVLWLLLRTRLRRGLVAVHRSSVAITGVESEPLGRSFLSVCVVGFATFYSRFGIQQTLVPLIAYQVIGMSVQNLGFALSGIAVLNIVCALFLAGLSDRVGRKRVIVSSLAGVAVSTFAYVFHAGPVGFLVALACYGVFSSIGGGTPAAYVADVARGSRRGPAIGVYRTCGDVAGIVGPIVVGYAVDINLSAAVAISVGVNAVAALVFAFFARETVPLRRRPPRELITAAAPPAYDWRMPESFDKITMFGASWCSDCRRSKALLDKLNVDYDHVDVEAELDGASRAEAISGRKNIPVVVFPDATHFVEPTDAELQAKLTEVGATR